MIIKTYTRGKFEFPGQDIESWTKIWNLSTRLLEGSRNAEKDHLSGFFREYFPKPPQRILEGGCGTGKYVIVYRCMGYDIIGVDFSGDTIRRLKQEMGKDFPVYEGNVLSLPFNDAYFDCYFSGGVIEHFEEGPDKPLKEARRVIKKGGVLLATVPYINFLRRLYFMLFSRKEDIGRLQKNVKKCQNESNVSKGYKFFEYIFDVNSLSPYFKSNGFIIEKTYPTNLLWGELGALARRLIPDSKNQDAKSTNMNFKSPGFTEDKNHAFSFVKNMAYDFAVTENMDKGVFKIPLKMLNYFSGHLILFVARAI